MTMQLKQSPWTWPAVMQAAALASTSLQLAGDDRQPPHTDAQPGCHLFWRLGKPGGGKLFFLGSLHFGDRRLYPLPQVVEQAFETSDRVILETTLDGSPDGTVETLMMQAAIAGDGNAMRETVTEKTYRIFEDSVRQLGLDPGAYEPYRTWYCANALMTTALRRAGVLPGLGVDRTIFGRALARGRSVDAFETPEFQIELFAGLDDQEAEQLLLQALSEISHTDRFVTHMLDAYVEGDLDALQELVTGGFNEKPALKKRFFSDRNNAWMSQIQQYVQEPGTDLVVVGTGHLIGPDGLIARCRNAGWAVTRL